MKEGERPWVVVLKPVENRWVVILDAGAGTLFDVSLSPNNGLNVSSRSLPGKSELALVERAVKQFEVTMQASLRVGHNVVMMKVDP